jgi:hypothetical protein
LTATSGEQDQGFIPQQIRSSQQQPSHKEAVQLESQISEPSWAFLILSIWYWCRSN